MHLKTDILVIGGGSAGCMAVIAAREHNPNADILIVEKGGDLCRTGSIAREMDGLNIVVRPGKAS